jgi:hypothetical protein
VIHAAFVFGGIVHKQETAPVMVLNVNPHCYSQYRRLYNTTRIPGKESDRLLTLSYRRLFRALPDHRLFLFPNN